MIRSDWLCQKAFIGGTWVDAHDLRTFEVKNPATQTILALVVDSGEQEALQAVEAAASAGLGWRAFLAKQRAVMLRSWFDLIVSHQEDLALLATLESGKPLAESRSEVLYAAGLVEWFSDEGSWLPSHLGISHSPWLRVNALPH